MRAILPAAAGAVVVAACLTSCTAGSAGGATGSPAPGASTCPAPSASDRPEPTASQPVDGGAPPPAPLRVEVRAESGTRASVRVVAPTGTSFESSELRVFVDGCRVPWTDEGDQLPTQTVTGLHGGDRLLVLARLNGEGGNSAETASPVVTMPSETGPVRR